MTPEEVKERVLREIGDRTTNSYGWEFRQFLLAVPQSRSYDGEMLWTVLIERSVERGGAEGYHVIFDPEIAEFGLAYGGVCIGLYGGFMEALDAM